MASVIDFMKKHHLFSRDVHYFFLVHFRHLESIVILGYHCVFGLEDERVEILIVGQLGRQPNGFNGKATLRRMK